MQVSENFQSDYPVDSLAEINLKERIKSYIGGDQESLEFEAWTGDRIISRCESPGS